MGTISERFAAELDSLTAMHEAEKIRLDAMISRIKAHRKEIERLHKELLILEAE